MFFAVIPWTKNRKTISKLERTKREYYMSEYNKMKNIKRELEWERELNVECDIVEDHTQQDASNRAKETKAGKTILFFLFFPCCKDVLWLKSFDEEE